MSRGENEYVTPGPPVSSTNKADRHDISEILLKVALNTITPHNPHYRSLDLTILCNVYV
jgi:hypothetical protein